MNNEDRMARAIIDPSSVFSDPMAVVDDDNFADEQKIKILKSWEYDALEMQVADEEGFPARESGNLLVDVVAALHRLGAGPDIAHSPPTKQVGV